MLFRQQKFIPTKLSMSFIGLLTRDLQTHNAFMTWLFSFLADDPCNPDPCKNAATCQVLPLNSYYCACPVGWTGANCEEGICSKQLRVLILLFGQLKMCTCFRESLYSKNNLFPFCVLDIKECSLTYNICQNGGTCEERLGDYYCSCALGFAGKNCDKGQ